MLASTFLKAMGQPLTRIRIDSRTRIQRILPPTEQVSGIGHALWLSQLVYFNGYMTLTNRSPPNEYLTVVLVVFLFDSR